ncbi:uncharacterized protein LOC128672203 [Plodia interpunctella]|uniref:uncharacterized protein LOC128672203 n=1 Tax=Plodia interpunctella TaxID=58824 RepID=UPI0031015616
MRERERATKDYKLIPARSRQKKNLLMLNGYTFAQNHTPRLWYCSQKRNGCKAKIKMSDNGYILRADTDHCHTPPMYYINKLGEYRLYYKLIPSRQKKNLLMLNGYTFAQNHSPRLWYCSQKRNGCKAKINMSHKGRILYADKDHCHTPPEYYVTKTGEYVLMKSKKC